MTENNSPLISVIMPAYNSGNFIKKAIQSVRIQTYKNWELIIIDDYSSDNTRNIIKNFSKLDKRIKYKFLKNNVGAAVARNEAIKISSGEYIAFLDSDDLWFKDKLFKQLKIMEEKNYFFTSTGYMKINESDEDLKKAVIPHEKLDYHGLLKECPGNSTVMYNAKILGKFYVPNIKKRNDYLMWLQVIKKAQKLVGLKEVLSCHRVREGSLSINKKGLVKYHWYIYTKIEKLSLIYSSYLMNYWVLKSLNTFIKSKK